MLWASFDFSNSYILDTLREMANQFDCLTFVSIIFANLSRHELILGYILFSRTRNIVSTASEMKTRKKIAPAHSLVIHNTKKDSKNRNIDKIKVTVALNELIEKGGRSILHISDEDFKELAKRFRVSQYIIKSTTAKLQPTVRLKRM